MTQRSPSWYLEVDDKHGRGIGSRSVSRSARRARRFQQNEAAIVNAAARVVGSFKFYASRYSVFAPITATTVFPVRSISDGTEPLAIMGTFNAVRR